MFDDYKPMIGKVITGYDLDTAGDRLTLSFSDGSQAIFNPYGDCCSSTWIESMDAPEALLGTVWAVEDIEMPDLGHVGTERHAEVDVVSYYGLKITTDKGRCVIDYRNDSNGYYGGYLSVEYV